MVETDCIIEKINTMADGSIRLTINIGEASPETVAKAYNLYMSKVALKGVFAIKDDYDEVNKGIE